jgi:hypothetical protein
MLSSVEPMTVERVGERLSRPGWKIQGWRVRQLFTTGVLPEPRRFGNSRIFFDEDLPAIRAALVEAGYLPADGAAE